MKKQVSPEESERLLQAIQEDRIQTLSMLTHGLTQKFGVTLEQLRMRTERLLSGLQNQQKEMGQGILEEISRLEAVISSLTELSTTATHEAHLIDLNDFVEDLVLFFQFRLSSGKIQMLNMVPEGLKARINSIYLKEILMALLSNAIESLEVDSKNTNREITVHAQILKADLIFHIEDNGPGMPPEMSRDLFLPFVTNKVGHVGLGLPLCRRRAQTEGWALKLKGTRPGSTQFELIIPQS